MIKLNLTIVSAFTGALIIVGCTNNPVKVADASGALIAAYEGIYTKSQPLKFQRYYL